MAKRDLLGVIDMLYSAALEPDQWEPALAAVSESVGAIGTTEVVTSALASDLVSLPAQMAHRLPRALPRRFEELAVDCSHDGEGLGAFSPRAAVERRPADADQSALARDRQLRVIRFDSPSCVHLTGKGRKERICPLWPETVMLLEKLLERQPRAPDQRLFVNRFGNHSAHRGSGSSLPPM